MIATVKLLTRFELAEKMDCCVATVDNWRRKGEIPVYYADNRPFFDLAAVRRAKDPRMKGTYCRECGRLRT